jgi:hypothetical protein
MITSGLGCEPRNRGTKNGGRASHEGKQDPGAPCAGDVLF